MFVSIRAHLRRAGARGRFFNEIGCEVVAIHGLKCGSATDIAHVRPPKLLQTAAGSLNWLLARATLAVRFADRSIDGP